MPETSKESYLNKIELPELKTLATAKDTELKRGQSEIELNLSGFSKEVKLPRAVIERYEKVFGAKKAKRAFKATIILFAILFVFLLAFQPSVTTTISDNSVTLQNSSSREIKDVTILNAQTMEAVINFSSLKSSEKVFFDLNNGTYIISAYRQLPVVITLNSPFEGIQKDNKGEGSNLHNPLKDKYEGETNDGN